MDRNGAVLIALQIQQNSKLMKKIYHLYLTFKEYSFATISTIGKAMNRLTNDGTNNYSAFNLSQGSHC
jgi:hypothetical protein